MTTHHFLTLDEKIDLINDSANGTGLSHRELSVKCKISKGACTTFCNGKKNTNATFFEEFGCK